MKKGICVLKCKKGIIRGVVHLEEEYAYGPVKFDVYIKDIPIGKHGFHIHRSGNELEGAKSMCDHFNPTGVSHGDRNKSNAHVGDLGNITSYEDIYYDEKGKPHKIGIVKETFIATRVRLRGKNTVFGRSLIVHSSEDDLGLGDHDDSLITGHSGERIMWGIIGVNEECS